MKSLALFFLVVGLHNVAAAEAIPRSNVAGAEYPRIEPNLAVTFRLRAPEARQVKLEGGAGLVKAPLAMTNSGDGIWSITTPPAVSGFHYYWFNVDGVRVNDGATFSYFGYGRETSGIDIPEAGADYYLPKDVPHGEVRAKSYFSKVTGNWRRAFVYTPPDYDKNTSVRYPVLYILHGAGENERGWIDQGNANFILDNLFAAKKARPMILVVDSGYASYPANSATTSTNRGVMGARTAAFEEMMLKDLIPLVDTNYRTMADREHRAMAGLSMGSMQTLSLTLKNLDHFAWIGAMSWPPAQNFDTATAFNGVWKDAETFNKKVKLLWFSAGTAETRFYEGLTKVHDALEKAGIKHAVYYSEGTDHEWQTWRRSLNELAPRLFQN